MTRKSLLVRLVYTVLLVGPLALVGLTGCPRNQTTHDDRTLEEKPHVETQTHADREDPFRP